MGFIYLIKEQFLMSHHAHLIPSVVFHKLQILVAVQ